MATTTSKRVQKKRSVMRVEPNFVHRLYAPVMVLLVIMALAVSHPGLPFQIGRDKGNVLAYATNVTVSGLLDATNQQRAANGAANLYANASLNQAAQNKANDMATRDYWSHNTPEGNPPWVFITATGYTYTMAGENLAYGFATSADVVTGWMNSPGHKANMLNTNFQEVGFGFANSSNYQAGGPQTIVVAMYARPSTPLVAPAATPPPTQTVQSAAPTPQATPATATPTSAAPAAAAAQPATPTTTTPPQEKAPVSEPVAQKPATAPQPQVVAQTKTTPISKVQLWTKGKAPFISFGVGVIASGSIMFLLLKHGLGLKRLIIEGERFILHHPLLDIALVSVAVLSLYLTRTVGMIL